MVSIGAKVPSTSRKPGNCRETARRDARLISPGPESFRRPRRRAPLAVWWGAPDVVCQPCPAAASAPRRSRSASPGIALCRASPAERPGCPALSSSCRCLFGPASRDLCLPAAATTIALFTDSCPLISAKSISGSLPQQVATSGEGNGRAQDGRSAARRLLPEIARQHGDSLHDRRFGRVVVGNDDLSKPFFARQSRQGDGRL